MLLELGPTARADALSWARLARRMSIELRTSPSELEGIATAEFLEAWSGVIDAITGRCEEVTEEFRLTEDLDDDVAEYLLHGMAKCLASSSLARLVTEDEQDGNLKFTLHLAEAMVDGLMAAGRDCEHYGDRVRSAVNAPRC